MTTQLLILGGTAEARVLADRLAERDDIEATLSLAGATRRPATMALPTRIGGFGGVRGLRDYISYRAIDGLIDATHPFAEQISANAVAAARASGRPIWRLSRRAWIAQPGDDWSMARDTRHAAAQLSAFGQRVFLSVGARSLAPFVDIADKHWIVRSIDRPDPPPAFADWTLITARPPFDLNHELCLLRDHAVDVVVAKNSGALATRAKLDAARALGIPVVLVERPRLTPANRVFDSVDAVLTALDDAVGGHTQPG